jgi:hypothetical protein
VSLCGIKHVVVMTHCSELLHPHKAGFSGAWVYRSLNKTVFKSSRSPKSTPLTWFVCWEGWHLNTSDKVQVKTCCFVDGGMCPRDA